MLSTDQASLLFPEYFRALKDLEEIEIVQQQLDDAQNHDGAKYFIYMVCSAGRILSKELPLQLAEEVVERYHNRANIIYGGKPPIDVVLQIIRAVPGVSKYELIK